MVLLKNAPFSRSEFRELLKTASVPILLDFDSDMILAGRYANLVYNWGKQPINVKVPERNESLRLKPYEYRFISE
jgi:hypothetical protein